MTNILTAMLVGVAFSIVSVVIHCLINNEPIGNWWFKLGSKLGIKLVDGVEVERWFYRPIWGCEKCFAGQLTLWLYPSVIIHYTAWHHVFAICTAIYITPILVYFINKVKSENDI
jgi:hypothetical protein